MSKKKTYKQWLVLDWKTGDSRTRKNKPSSSELKANEILAELKVDVEVPEVDVPTLAVQIDVPEPQVYQATLEAIDDEDLPDWTDAANEILADHRGVITDAYDEAELDGVVDQMATQTLMNAPGRPPVDQVHEYLDAQAVQMFRDYKNDADDQGEADV
jgi:hypothetical protein